jgi:hypothetical protein
MMTNGKIAVALVGGYLLGRTKKAKVALGLGMFLAGKKLKLNPEELGKLVTGSPLLSGLSDQVRKELFEATKSAATTALTNRAGSLAESLHERTLDLKEPGRALKGRAEDEDEDDAPHEEHEDDGADDREDGEDGGSTARQEKPRARGSADRGSGTAAKKQAARRPAKSTGSSGTARKSATGTPRKAAKSASSGTRKSASGARGTSASGRNRAKGGRSNG